MRRNTTLLVTTAVLLLAPLSAVAQQAAETQQDWWQSLLVLALQTAAAILTPVIGVLITLLLRRWGIQVQQKQVDAIVTQAVGFAEQKAKVALKDGAPKTPGAQKLQVALDIAQALMTQFKVKEMAKDKLVALIEAKLGLNGSLASPPAPANGEVIQ